MLNQQIIAFAIGLKIMKTSNICFNVRCKNTGENKQKL